MEESPSGSHGNSALPWALPWSRHFHRFAMQVTFVFAVLNHPHLTDAVSVDPFFQPPETLWIFLQASNLLIIL